MIATLLVALSLTVGRSDAPSLGAPISAATGARLLAPVDYQKQPKADRPGALLPPAAPQPKADPNATSPNGSGYTFWKADADLRQPLLFGAER